MALRVYETSDFEHPAIPNLMLSLDQRLNGAYLDNFDQNDGSIRMETIQEKQFRILWKQPIPMTPSLPRWISPK